MGLQGNNTSAAKMFGKRSQKLRIQLRHIGLPDRVEQPGSHWMNFHEIWLKTIFQKSFQIILVLLKSDKNDSYFTRRPMYIFDHISLNSYRMRNIADKHCRETQDTFYVQKYFPENRTVYEIIWRNMTEPERPQMAIRRMRFVCWISKATDTIRIWNAFRSSTATVVTRTRLSTLSVLFVSYRIAGNIIVKK